MKRFILLALMFAGSAQAACYGSDSYQTCYDDNGNTYNVMRSGDTTTVYGSNQYGDTWEQRSYHNGNTTTTYGQDADGDYWDSTTIHDSDGSGYMQYGTDSDGNSFSRHCYDDDLCY